MKLQQTPSQAWIAFLHRTPFRDRRVPRRSVGPPDLPTAASAGRPHLDQRMTAPTDFWLAA